MLDLYNEAYLKDQDYYINNKREKVYIPKESELLSQFIRRVLSIAKFEQSNNNLKKAIVNCETNPWSNYALLSFKIDADSDLNEVVSQYKEEYRSLKLELFGGE